MPFFRARTRNSWSEPVREGVASRGGSARLPAVLGWAGAGSGRCLALWEPPTVLPAQQRRCLGLVPPSLLARASGDGFCPSTGSNAGHWGRSGAGPQAPRGLSKTEDVLALVPRHRKAVRSPSTPLRPAFFQRLGEMVSPSCEAG